MRRKRFLRWSIILLVVVAFAEVGLRMLGLGNPLLQNHDAACDYLYSPGQQTTRYFSNNHINQYSMRSDDITAEKPAGTFRVMMVGDSVLYGTTYVDQSRIFASRIQQQLPEKIHQPVQVLNASCGGWATGNELGYLKSRGTFQSDIVVFVLNTGDFDMAKNVVDCNVEGYNKKPFCALSELWSHYLKPKVMGYPAHADAGSIASGTGGEVYERIDAVLENVQEAKNFANANRSGFVILFSPALGVSWENDGYHYGYGRLEMFAKMSDIPMVDMTAAYKQVPYKTLYDSGNIHLNPMGHDLVAAAFVQAVPELKVAVAKQLAEQRSMAAAAP